MTMKRVEFFSFVFVTQRPLFLLQTSTGVLKKNDKDESYPVTKHLNLPGHFIQPWRALSIKSIIIMSSIIDDNQ